MGASDPSGGRSFAFKRKGSVADSPTSASTSSARLNARPSSSSGWLGGGARGFTLAGFMRSSGSKVKEVIVPILATPTEGKEEIVSDSHTPLVSTFVTVPTPNTSRPAVDLSQSQTLTFDTAPRHTRRKSYSFTFKRKESVSDCPTAGSGVSVSRNTRPSSSSGWLGGGLAGFTRSSGSKVKEVIVPILATPIDESKEENVSDSSTSRTPPVSTFVTVPTSDTSRPAVHLSRTLTFDTPSSSPPPTRRKSLSLLTFPLKSQQALDHQASQLIAIAAERTGSLKSPEQSKNAGSFSKSFTSMMGGLSSLSLSRTSTREGCGDDKERGRSMGKIKRPKSASQAPSDLDSFSNSSTSRTRSQSPFSLRRFRTREFSPTPQALPLSQSEADLSVPTASLVLRSTAFSDDDSGDETIGADAETEYGSSSDEAEFDLITERNTEHNALIPHDAVDANGAVEIEDPDPVGEGVNVVIAPEPYFPSSLNTLGSMNRGKRNPRRRKSVKTHEPLPFHTSRPVFQRDRCTITITQGDPEGKLGTRKMRQYVVASDLSQESRYAVEWGIGTVLRDGDEMLIVTVIENDSKGFVVKVLFSSLR